MIYFFIAWAIIAAVVLLFVYATGTLNKRYDDDLDSN